MKIEKGLAGRLTKTTIPGIPHSTHLHHGPLMVSLVNFSNVYEIIWKKFLILFFNFQSLVIGLTTNSSHLKAINLGTLDHNILGLAIDKDVAGAGHIAALGQVDDEEEAGPGESVVELVEVLAVPALNHLQRELQK